MTGAISGANSGATDQAAASAVLPICTQSSSLIEKVLEYRFLGEVTAELLQRGLRFEILRSDVDGDGHDLVIEASGVVRYIQLKAMMARGTRTSITVNTGLAAKPSACVIWMIYDPESYDLISFRWFGAEPGQPLPALGDRIARHSRANAKGAKANRPLHRVVPASRFIPVFYDRSLVDLLFLPGRRQDGMSRLMSHLETRRVDADYPKWLEAVRRGDFTAIPADLDWRGSVELAHLIDGYRLAEAAGFGDGFTWAERQLALAKSARTWPGAPFELWISLFLEHRRWRFSTPYEPSEEMTALLDCLVRQLRQDLVLAAGFAAESSNGELSA